MYHAMGYSSILVMQAGMTFEPKDMDAAMTALRESLQTCQMYVEMCQPSPKDIKFRFLHSDT